MNKKLTPQRINDLQELKPILDRFAATRAFSVNYPQKLQIEAIGAELGLNVLNKSCGKCIANHLDAIIKYRNTLEEAASEIIEKIEPKKEPKKNDPTPKQENKKLGVYQEGELKVLTYQELTKLAARHGYEFKKNGRKAALIIDWLCNL